MNCNIFETLKAFERGLIKYFSKNGDIIFFRQESFLSFENYTYKRIKEIMNSIFHLNFSSAIT